MQRYTVEDLKSDFPDDKACLEWLKNNRWPDGIHCRYCDYITKHHLMESRRSYCCQQCGNHVHPTADTIFHKSPTPLTLWFHAVFLMASTRCGISAKQVEREIGVTYKTAWRMCHLIRQQLDEGKHPLSGDVEVDESYFGGKHPGKPGRGAEGKTAVVGAVQRQGPVNAETVPDVKGKTVVPIILATVDPSATVHTDEFQVYDGLTELGYDHQRIAHASKEYVRGNRSY